MFDVILEAKGTKFSKIFQLSFIPVVGMELSLFEGLFLVVKVTAIFDNKMGLDCFNITLRKLS